jgi:stage II sporulation protein P
VRKTTVALCALVFLGVFALISQAEEWGERADGGYYRVVDLEGKFLTVTALELGKGDLYIDAENQRYVIDHFNGDTAVARHDGKERMPVIREAKQSLWAGAIEWAAQIMGRERVNRKLVGIYHTHGDECYTPTSGTESRTPRGDIYEVGAALAQALEKEGYEVQHSWDTFVPHDGQAYLRSRRTASELSKSRPQTMIDVHRDAVPDPQEYRTQVSGQPTSKVRLVVGRQNHLRDTNLAYAKRIKAIADEKFPNLVHGIFHAKGNYNPSYSRCDSLEFALVTSQEYGRTPADSVAVKGYRRYDVAFVISIHVQPPTSLNQQDARPLRSEGAALLPQEQAHCPPPSSRPRHCVQPE